MRNCPNCSEEIQDDAVFCKHCHTPLEPSPTLTSMRKCPYCAEWVSLDSERCKYCNRSLIAAGAAHTAPFVETSSTADDLAQALRESMLDDDSEEAAAIAAAAAEFIAEDPGGHIAGVEDEVEDEPVAAFSDLGMADSIYDEPQSELRRSLYDEEASPPEDGALDDPQSDLRSSLHDEPEEDSTYASLSDGVETPLADEPQSEPQQSLYDEPFEGPLYDTPAAEEQGSITEEPQSDLRRSLYDDPLEEEAAAKSSTYYVAGDGEAEYVEPVGAGTGSSIWMAGSDDDEGYQDGTGAITAGSGEFGRSVAGTEGVSELRADVSGPPGRIRRNAGSIAKSVIFLAVIGAAVAGLFVALFGADGWGVFELSEGPLGAIISEAIATDIPPNTPIPLPTSTLRSAPTLPPDINATAEASGDGSAGLPPQDGTPSSDPGCVSWEAITVQNEGSEACVYGVIKRWWAGDEIPFISIFSEDEGTFSIIDRTDRHPVGPGSCIMARGTVEIMGGVRPNIDAQGVIEDCPEGVVEG